MAVLSDADIDAAVATLGGWQHLDGALRRSVTFPSFLDGVEAVRRAADLAERADHHPDIDIRFNKVTLRLTTHDADGVTKRDVDLAEAVQGLL